jgi:hypothetical protein
MICGLPTPLEHTTPLGLSSSSDHPKLISTLEPLCPHNRITNIVAFQVMQTFQTQLSTVKCPPFLRRLLKVSMGPWTFHTHQLSQSQSHHPNCTSNKGKKKEKKRKKKIMTFQSPYESPNCLR